jgi:hypothetical protein
MSSYRYSNVIKAYAALSIKANSLSKLLYSSCPIRLYLPTLPIGFYVNLY